MNIDKKIHMKIKNFKQFESLSNDRFELIGDSIDEVLDSVNVLKFHYGKDMVLVEDETGHKSGDKFGVYITFSEEIPLSSGGVDPKSNIVREMNYILEQEQKKSKLYKIN